MKTEKTLRINDKALDLKSLESNYCSDDTYLGLYGLEVDSNPVRLVDLVRCKRRLKSHNLTPFLTTK